MESIQINLKSPQRVIREIHPINFIMEGDELLITLRGKECYHIDAGQTLVFKRYIYREDNTIIPITAYSKILYEDAEHIIHASIPYWGKYRVVKCDEIDGSFILTTEEHNIFAQDINDLQELYLYDANDTYLSSMTADRIAVPDVYSLMPVKKTDCLTSKEAVKTCDLFATCKSITTYSYSFLPDRFSTDKIFIDGSGLTTAEKNAIKDTKYISTKFNPFYYYYVDPSCGETRCVLYQDPWWTEFKNSETLCVKYNNSGNTQSIMGVDDAYWNVGIGLSMDGNEDGLGGEDTFSTNLVTDVEDSVIPEIIDMERVKYSPITTGGTSAMTSITLDFHFRERKENDGKNAEQTKDNVYADGWYIDPENEIKTWWNNSTLTSTTIDSTKMSDFITNSGKKSDLLGLLNFTDGDVYYQKKKVSQSFVRLSYYSKKNEDEDINPLNARLLYYSTVFFDGGKLYGKYVKQLMNIENSLGTITYEKTPTDNTLVVLCTASARVDSEIVITNEFDRTSSAEGFNIYLFKDDAPTQENPEKTIYMKVEFNHAGNGKTIPMILSGMWPKNAGTYTSLKTENYFKSLYIPIKLKYLNGKYYYTIENAEYENDNLRLILLEPKLDM